MCERRALLDPEMYKISEEDSQDEEVLSAGGLATLTEDVLRLGEQHSGAWSANINNNHAPPVRLPSSNHNNNYAHHHPHHQSSTSFSSAMHKFAGGSGSSTLSKYKILGGPPPHPSGGSRYHHPSNTNAGQLGGGSSAVRGEANVMDGDNLDWPESSTNSDSCLSSDDRQPSSRSKPRRGGGGSSGGGVGSASSLGASNSKYLSKTYFGDHVKRIGDSSLVDPYSGYHREESSSIPPPRTQHHTPHQKHHHSQQQQQQPRRNANRRSRRRSHPHSRHHSNHHHHHRDSSSGSGSDCSGRSSSPCADCTGGAGGGHHPHRRTSTKVGSEGGESGTSSEREHYEESSYSESSYDAEDYADYDDEDDPEYFDDIVKFLDDSEIESNITPDGDMFLLEYSADSELSESEGTTVVEREQLAPRSQSETRQNGPDTEVVVPLERGAGLARSSSTKSGGGDGREGSLGGEGRSGGMITTPGPSPSNLQQSSSKSGGHFQKSGKGAKGKISRLLKRRRGDGGSGGGTSGKPDQSSSSSSSRMQPDSVEGGPPNCNVLLPQPTILPPTHGDPSSKELSPPKGSSSSSSAKHKPSSVPSAAAGGAPEKVFRFKDEHGGETRTVFVDVPQSRNSNLGRRATLIESILGIIPGRFSTPTGNNSTDGSSSSSSNDRIMVAGFVPDGVASRYRHIKIGDWLVSVDDIVVGHANVDHVLNSRCMYGKRRTAFETEYLRLKLTLRRVAGCMVSLPTSKFESGGPLKTSIRGSPPGGGGTSCSRVKSAAVVVSPHVQSNVALLFISSVTPNCAINEKAGSSNGAPPANNNNNHPKEKSKDVVYAWPKESESKIVKALAASQGLFSTLYRLLRDVTGSHPVVSKVVIDDCEMDVTYTSDDNGKSLLLLAIATSLSTFTIERQAKLGGSGLGGSSNGTGTSGEGKKREKKIRWREPQAGGVTVSTRVMTRMESLLKFQFGSLARAFKEPLREGKVTRFLANSICALNDLSEDFLFLQVPGNFLRFPNCIRSGIDDVLYSFETSDALFSRAGGSGRAKDSSGDNIPIFHCHGSCLMYKGFLVTSHLENELASCFHSWWRTQLGLWALRRNTLLEKWKPVSRLVLWQQTYLPRKAITTTATTGKSPSHSNPTRGTQQGETELEGGGRRDEDGEDDEMEEEGGEEEDDDDGASGAFSREHRAPCYSALVGIGNFTLGFVLEHLTDYEGRVRPDVGWIRRAMTTLCRLYHSGLSRSFECWVDKPEREEFVELCWTSSSSSVSSSKHHRHHHPQTQLHHHHHQDKMSSHNSSTSSTSQKGPLHSAKKVVGTSSILKNSEVGPPPVPPPVHSSPSVGSSSSSSSSTSHHSSPFSSSMMKSFMIGTSSLSSSLPSSIRPGIVSGHGNSGFAATTSSTTTTTPFDDPSVPLGARPGSGEPLPENNSDGEGDDMDDTTTGTGSDNSSFKWYETGVDPNSGPGGTTGLAGDVKSVRVTKGSVLFDYVQVEFGRGVLLSTKDVHEGWFDVVRHNFRQSATVVHHILHKAANARQRLEERGNDKKWVSRALAPISEHGILFNCQITDPRDLHKKKPRKRDVYYWVVGRIYPEEREIYVCYEDGPMSQNLVEIAYKIALNVHC